MVSGRDMNVEISLRLRPETSWTKCIEKAKTAMEKRYV